MISLDVMEVISVNVSVVWNPSTCDCEILEYLKNYAYMKSIDSLITCDEIIDIPETMSSLIKIYIKNKK